MKKLALLLPGLLALPLAAIASPQENQSPVAEQFATAAANCASNDIAPTSSQWGPCVNRYLQDNYKYQLMKTANHWLVMVRVISQFAPDMLMLPVPLPATSASWNLPIRLSGVAYQDGNNWCVAYREVGSNPLSCSANPEVAFLKLQTILRNSPKRSSSDVNNSGIRD